jgi:hypothetical protein
LFNDEGLVSACAESVAGAPSTLEYRSTQHIDSRAEEDRARCKSKPGKADTSQTSIDYQRYHSAAVDGVVPCGNDASLTNYLVYLYNVLKMQTHLCICIDVAAYTYHYSVFAMHEGGCGR